MDIEKVCKICGKPLKPSQYASNKEEGQPTARYEDDLVCSDQSCPNGEKEVKGV